MPDIPVRLWLGALALSASALASAQTALLSASCDNARDFYQDYNAAFVAHYKKTTGRDVRIELAPAGDCDAQVRAVLDGLGADVVALDTLTGMQRLADQGVVTADWRKKFADDAAPVTSTVLFLVRKGNPKRVVNWPDLARPGVRVVMADPKKTGGDSGRAAYLAAWGYAKNKHGGSDAKAARFVGRLLANVPAFAAGAGAAAATFLQQRIGDVLIASESELPSIARAPGASRFEVVYPRFGMLVEHPVALVERTVKKKGTRELAEAYLKYLYSDDAQEIAARHGLRPRSTEVLQEHAARFKPLKLSTVDELFGSPASAQQAHFDDGGSFDRLVAARGR